MKRLVVALILLFLFFGCILPEASSQKNDDNNDIIPVTQYNSDLPPPLPGEDQTTLPNNGPPALPE